MSEVDSVDVEPRPLPQPPTKPTCKLSSVKLSAADGYTQDTIGHDVELNKQGEIVLKQRLLPTSSGKRAIKKPKRFIEEDDTPKKKKK